MDKDKDAFDMTMEQVIAKGGDSVAKSRPV